MENIIERRRYLRKQQEIEDEIGEETGFVERILSQIMMQVLVASYIIAIGALCRNVFPKAFYKIYNKYDWIIKEDITIPQIYNKSINYINAKFDFNIPTTNENTKTNQRGENTSEYIEEINYIEEIKVEQSQEEIMGFDSMKNIANEIKQKHTFIKPTTGVITCSFGNRSSSNNNISSFHLGIDIANDIGTDIVSSVEGVVEEVSSNSIYGKYIKITNGDILMVYAHCSQTLVTTGDNVSQGQLIAKMGQTGIATGPHLHFEVRKNGNVINPEYILELQ